MPRDLRHERSAHVALSSQVFERQRVQDWVRTKPARLRAMRRLADALIGAGSVGLLLAVMAGIGVLLGWRG